VKSKLFRVGDITDMDSVRQFAMALEPAFSRARWRWNPQRASSRGHFPTLQEISETITYLVNTVESDISIGTGGLTVVRNEDGTRTLFVDEKLGAAIQESERTK
jgi:hypothetical protein